LPFRSYETAGNDAGQGTIQTKMKAANPNTNTGVTEAGNYITVKVGEPYVVPLRWNNPHAAELEVNIWIMKGSQKYVVPVLKPTCSGSGYQDNVFDFKVQNDFPANVCNATGACVLQVYAHSVESRMYSSGTPVIVTGGTGIWDEKAAKEAEKDLAFGLDKLRPLCLSRADPTSHHTNAVLYKARLSSDVYNHAYQNSDFSPYAGQQPQHISQNLQAACILKMTANNFGELGKRYIKKTAPEAQKYANKIDKKARKLIKQYEKTTDRIINSIKGNVKNSDKFATSSLGVDDVVECEDKKGYCAKGLTCVSAAAAASGGTRRRRGGRSSSLSDTSGARRRRRRGSPLASGYCANEAGSKQPRTLLFQNTATCFRCAETGSTTTRRLNTNTYIPSFEIKGKENINKALRYVNDRQLSTGFLQNPATGTISEPNEESATLSIYMAVLTEMWKEFKMASDGTYCAKYKCGQRRRRPAAEVDLEKYKFTYRGPVLKNTTGTLSDANGGVNYNFKKRDANNNKDGGYYSAAKAWSLQSRNGGSSTAMPSGAGPLAQSTMYGQTLAYPPKPNARSLMEFSALQEEDDEEEDEVDDEDDVARSTPTVDDAGDFAANLMEGDDVLQKEDEEDDEDEEEDDDVDGAANLMEGDDMLEEEEGDNDEENEDEDEDEGGRSTLAAVDADGNLERPRLMRTKGDGDLKMTGRLSVGRSSAEQSQRLMRTRMPHNVIPGE